MSDFVHIELATQDPAAAKKFYGKLFGWKLKDMAMEGGTYTMFDTGGKGPHGGITKTMGDQPTGWINYIGVASVKKTIEKARAMGAKVYVEYQEIPGMGALGVMADPTGATIAVWEPKAMPKVPARKKAAKKAAKKAPAKKKAAKKAAKRR
jgi:uncharacterized protein